MLASIKHIKVGLLLAICIEIYHCTLAQTTLFLKPGAEGKDAMVHSYLEYTNLGNNQSLVSAAWTYQGNFGIIRTLVFFDLSSICPGSEILTADLSFFYDPFCGHEGHGGENSAWLRRVVENWNENSVIWWTQPDITFENQILLPPSISSSQDYVNIDVTNLIQDMIDDPDNSYGFQLRMVTEEIYRSLTFASGDHFDSDLWPEIEISYTCHVGLGNDTILCEGDSLILDAGTCFSQFLWNTGSTLSSEIINSSGTYWITVYDGNDCEASDTINVEFYPDILGLLDLGSDTILCWGEELLLEAGDGYETYEWQNSASGTNFLVQEEGLYWVTVTSPCGIATDSIIVDYAPELFPDLGNDTILCTGDSLPLDPGNGFTGYQWNTGSADSMIFVTISGEYWVFVSDAVGCQACDSINIVFSSDTVYQNPLGPDTSLCFGEELFFSLNEDYYSYLWQDGSTDNEFLVQNPGLYWVTVTGECGTVTDSVNVGFYPEIILNLGNDTLLCQGEAITLSAGSGFTGYLWSDGSTGVQNYVTDEGLYSVQVWDANNCSAEDEIYITVYIIDLNLGCDTMLCPGNTIEISAGESFEYYAWNDTTFTGLSSIITQNPGVYWVEVIDSVQSVGCHASDTILISNWSLPVIPDLNDAYSICQGDTIELNAGIGSEFNYLWNTGKEDSLISISQQGQLSVMIFNVCDTVSKNICISVNPVPDVNIFLDTSLVMNGIFRLLLNKQYETILWSTGSQDTMILVSKPGEYWVTAGNEFGCASSDTLQIEPVNCDFKVPLVFTPNGDEHNPVFRINYPFLKEFEIVLVDRWGKPVYRSDNPEFEWDGTSSGKKCADGVYYWIIKYNCTGITGSYLNKKGSVTILR